MAEIRLIKVLRELDISTETAVNLLKASGIIIENNHNAMISEEAYETLKKQFLSKPKEILELEKKLGIELFESKRISSWGRTNTYALNANNEVMALNLSACKISNISALADFKELTYLDLRHNKLKNVSLLKNLTHLNYLNLSSNLISDISFLESLSKMDSLNLMNNKITNISSLAKLKKLTYLFLSNNEIFDCSALSNLNKVRNLLLSYNQIVDISFLKDFNHLIDLDLSYNQIVDISPLRALNKLKTLDLRYNQINDIRQFEFIENFSHFYIVVNGNPYFVQNEFNLNSSADNFNLIKNELSKSKEVQKKYILPAKVMLLGNTKSGKSTLLDYLLQTKTPKKINKIEDSTHVLTIEKKPKVLKKDELPNAVFYDFGGQDYYHGLYHAFMSKNSINAILWNTITDFNQIQLADRNEQTIRNFNKNYWLNQLKYFYTKDYIDENYVSKIENEVLFLVQTHADLKHKRETYKGDSEDFNLNNEFYIALQDTGIEKSLTFKMSLNYLEANLDEQIENKRITKNEPQWYGGFMNYILNKKGSDHTSLKEIEKYYKREDKENIKYLAIDLEQIAYSGLILYYKDDEDLKDIAWLDPSETLKKIHENILSKKSIKDNKGILSKDKFDKIVNDEKLIKLLSNQKVIFYDEYDKNYIIPGYLPLTASEDKLYELLTFDFIEPVFILKFEYFIPFGLINQLICFYGNNPDKKYYWRDQLLFTKDSKHKILIKLDFTNLEISVSIKSNESGRSIDTLKQQIFADILNLYWDEKPLVNYFTDENSNDDIIGDITIDNLVNGKLKASVSHDLRWFKFRSPDDMYISIDNKTFIHHKTLENLEDNTNKIIAFPIKLEEFNKQSEGEKIEINFAKMLNKSKPIEQASGLYKLYTTNKNIAPVKKIFISYAKENKKEVNDFLRQIAPFKINKEVETWHCSELELGEDWETKIMAKFYEADIILYFVSTHFFSTPFILDVEVTKGIERDNDINDNVILIPIILEKIHWEDLLGKYNSNFKGIPINKYDKGNDAWFEIVDDLKKHFRTSNPNRTASLLGQSKAKMDAQENAIGENN